MPSRLHEDNVDTGCAEILWDLKTNRDPAKEIRLPRFNKGKDDREPEESWDVVLGVADIVMYEGWRVGIDHPLYASFNAALDCLVYLEADLATVRGWKKESSQRDAEREGMAWNEATAMKSWDTWIEPFVEKYELPLISQADIVISKSSTHRIRKCARGLIPYP